MGNEGKGGETEREAGRRGWEERCGRRAEGRAVGGEPCGETWGETWDGSGGSSAQRERRGVGGTWGETVTGDLEGRAAHGDAGSPRWGAPLLPAPAPGRALSLL